VAPEAALAAPEVASSGLEVTVGQRSFGDTVAALEAAIEAKGLTLMAKVDHAANAAKAGLELPATTLLVFGKPAVGTKLMSESRTVAIDLPQKILVWQEGDEVRIAYNSPAHLGSRHGLATKEVLDKISTLLAALVQAAAGP